jgi:hypothetical protein
LSGLVETTDATATTLLAHTISDTNTAVLITANIVAYSTGNDRGGWVISGTFYRDAAGALQESTTTTQHSKASGYSAAFDVSGNDVRVRITGAAGETVKWKGFATAYEVT